MVILYIYLGTVVFCLSSAFLTSKAIDREFEKKGYTYNKKNKNVYKDIINFLSFVGVSLIPVINLSFGWTCISKYKEISESIFNDNLVVGKLVKIEEKEENFDSDKLDDISSGVITYNVNSELTREEKIKFLKEEYYRLTNKKIDEKCKKNKSKQKRKI